MIKRCPLSQIQHSQKKLIVAAAAANFPAPIMTLPHRLPMIVQPKKYKLRSCINLSNQTVTSPQITQTNQTNKTRLLPSSPDPM